MSNTGTTTTTNPITSLRECDGDDFEITIDREGLIALHRVLSKLTMGDLYKHGRNGGWNGDRLFAIYNTLDKALYGTD